MKPFSWTPPAQESRAPRVNNRSCVVFDLDDTLCLERDYVRSGMLAVDTYINDQFSINGFFQSAWNEFVAGRRGTIFNAALQHCGLRPDASLISEMVHIYRRHSPSLLLLGDAAACLSRLQSKVRLGLISDGPSASQHAKATALGLDRWFDRMIFTSDLGEDCGKPCSKAYLLLQEDWGCAPEHCTYIGDNPAKDFIAPRRLGWKSVRIRRPLSLHEKVCSGNDVDYEVQDLSQLLLTTEL
jgi:putative hydrolase of the HAD superfamily